MSTGKSSRVSQSRSKLSIVVIEGEVITKLIEQTGTEIWAGKGRNVPEAMTGRGPRLGSVWIHVTLIGAIVARKKGC